MSHEKRVKRVHRMHFQRQSHRQQEAFVIFIVVVLVLVILAVLLTIWYMPAAEREQGSETVRLPHPGQEAAGAVYACAPGVPKRAL
ncbi:MAG TPA: hypothetical protein VM283_06545 [Armatimonadota bacterium]|nr:hypothetical protein [Armatimonadota bacterium]